MKSRTIGTQKSKRGWSSLVWTLWPSCQLSKRNSLVMTNSQKALQMSLTKVWRTSPWTCMPQKSQKQKRKWKRARSHGMIPLVFWTIMKCCAHSWSWDHGWAKKPKPAPVLIVVLLSHWMIPPTFLWLNPLIFRKIPCNNGLRVWIPFSHGIASFRKIFPSWKIGNKHCSLLTLPIFTISSQIKCSKISCHEQFHFHFFYPSNPN